MTHELKTYSRLKPSVLAIQITPGVEDNWIATDVNGRELSRASTIAAVQQAAPGAADYSPVLDLPGLQGQVLHMGDYVINDGDGVFFTMPKDTFEELFGEGEGKELKVVGGKNAEKTYAYGPDQLTGDQIYAHLNERDEEVIQLSAYRDELLKIAEQVGEEADPFAAWETIALWKQDLPNSQKTNTDGSSSDGSSSTASEASTAGDKENPTSASTSDPATGQSQASVMGEANSGQQGSAQSGSNSSAPSELTSGQKASEPSTSANGQSTTDPKPKDPLDHDENGKKGGSKPKAKTAAGKTSAAT